MPIEGILVSLPRIIRLRDILCADEFPIRVLLKKFVNLPICSNRVFQSLQNDNPVAPPRFATLNVLIVALIEENPPQLTATRFSIRCAWGLCSNSLRKGAISHFPSTWIKASSFVPCVIFSANRKMCVGSVWQRIMYAIFIIEPPWRICRFVV